MAVVAGLVVLGCVVALLPAQESSRRTASKYRLSPPGSPAAERPSLTPRSSTEGESAQPQLIPAIQRLAVLQTQVPARPACAVSIRRWDNSLASNRQQRAATPCQQAKRKLRQKQVHQRTWTIAICIRS